VDSRALSRATGVQAGTLNAWIQRGYVPGMDVEVSGRRRDFDVDTATHIAVMAELMQLGFGAAFAAVSAISARHKKRLLFAKRAIRAVGTPNFEFQGSFGFEPFESEAELSKALANFATADFELPSAYVVIDVERIAARMRQAEEEWQERGEIKGLGLPIRLVGRKGDNVESADPATDSNKTS
jgi:hypothetical protein